MDEDVTVLGEQVAELHVDTLADDLGHEAADHYRRALEGYDQAKALLAASETAEDVVAIEQVVADARYHRAAVLAIGDGEPVPERREPCFFNPQHGPSMQDVEWTPPGGTPRVIATCAADARRLAAGTEPLVRMVRVGDRWVPWHLAGSVQGAIDAGAQLARSGSHGVHGQQNLAQAYLNQTWAAAPTGAASESDPGTVGPACDTGRVPEGDSVWKLARRLDRQLVGRTIARSDFRTPRLATRDVSGREVLGHDTHGKHLLTRFSATAGSPAATLHSHLKMDGSWSTLAPGKRLPAQAPAARAAGARRSTTTGPSTASGCTTSTWCRPTARPTSSATSAPTRCATTGTPPRPYAASRPTRRCRSSRPCSTSAAVAGLRQPLGQRARLPHRRQPVDADRRGRRRAARRARRRRCCTTPRPSRVPTRSPPARPSAATTTG